MTKEESDQLRNDLKRVKEFIESIETKSSFLKSEAGDYYEEKDGLVTFYRASGHPFMIMPKEDFEEIRKWNGDV